MGRLSATFSAYFTWGSACVSPDVEGVHDREPK